MSTRPGRDHFLEEPFLAEIGRIAIHWSGLEAGVDMLIGAMLETSTQQTHSITTGLGFPFRLDILADLGKQMRRSKSRNELAAIISEIRSLLPERNFAIHAFWIGPPTATVLGIIQKRNAMGSRSEEWEISHLESITQRIREARVGLGAWQQRFERNRLRPALPKKPM